jgi:uncharacterized protein YjiS (DUF1127 family)
MPGFTSRLHAVYQTVFEYRARRHAIQALSAMDDSLLKDIGLSRAGITSAVRGRGPLD